MEEAGESAISSSVSVDPGLERGRGVRGLGSKFSGVRGSRKLESQYVANGDVVQHGQRDELTDGPPSI